MILYPAIDLIDGQCVRLQQGNFTQVTRYQKDALQVAQQYEQQGASYLHVVDLEGAQRGQIAQSELIVSLAKHTNLKIQAGGGIRTENDINHLLENGIDRVVIGSQAFREPLRVKAWIQKYGAERFTLACDINIINNEPILAVQGWQVSSGMRLWDLLEHYESLGNLQVLCTDIGVDGTLTGPNFAIYEHGLEQFPTLHWLASGGVASLSDLKSLSKLGVQGVIIGKALYENNFTLTAAIEAVSLC